MEILEILKVIEKELKELNFANSYSGLCSVANVLCGEGILSLQDLVRFTAYYIRTKKNQVWYYDCKGKKVKDSSQFAWPIYVLQPRLAWLEHNIKRNE